MPLRKSERAAPVYEQLSTQKASPRAVMAGRWHDSPATASSGTPAAYCGLRDWGAGANRPGPRIGAKSIGPANRLQLSGRGATAMGPLDPDTMLGAHLRSKSLGIPQYDPPPGLGDVVATPERARRARGAVMVGCHTKAPGEGSAADTSALPSPLNYATEYGTVGYAATQLRKEAMRASTAGTFGTRAQPRDERETFPGPGEYEPDYRTAIAPLGPDDSERNRSSPGRGKMLGSRPSTVQSSFSTTSRGVSMKGRNWRDHSAAKSDRERHDSGPGPSDYAPVLPFIGASNSRTPSMKFRQAHPFVDTLAAHDCAKRSIGAHDERKRFRATPRL